MAEWMAASSAGDVPRVLSLMADDALLLVPGREPFGKGPFVAALALATRSEPFSAPGWLFELRYDGFRLFAKKDGADVVLRYRTGRNATSVFPEVAAAVAPPRAASLLEAIWRRAEVGAARSPASV